MPSPKHGALAAPQGIALTGTLLHEVRTRKEDINFECNDNAGAFSCGKSLRKKTTLSLSGEGLSNLALPSAGGGAATAASPHIDSTDVNEKSEGAAEFAVEAHYYEAGSGDFA